VHRIELPSGTPGWLVTGYEAVRAALADPRLSKQPARPSTGGLLPPEIDAAINSDLLHRDPPDHARLRRLVSTAFTRRRVDALAPRVQQIADALLDDLAVLLAEDGPADLIATYAYPLPIAVISELLGVPLGGRRSSGTGRRPWRAGPPSARRPGSPPRPRSSASCAACSSPSVRLPRTT
jgi:cytochrome P450